MTMGGVLRLIVISSAQLFCFGRLNFRKEQPTEEISIKARCANCGHNTMVLDKDDIVVCERCGGAW